MTPVEKACIVAEKYGSLIRPIKGSARTYVCCSFPDVLSVQMKDYICARFEVTEIGTYDITFIIKL